MTIRLPPDPTAQRHWLVCESSDRWIRAVRRFAPELIPPPLVAVAVTVRWSELRPSLARHPHAAVLCEITPASFVQACECLSMISSDYPRSLRLMATDRLTDRQRIVLSELGAAAQVPSPECLPRLSPMLAAHFASSEHFLD